MAAIEKVLQFRVFLEGVRPPVWRRIQVSDRFTLARLHDVIQLVMGWEDCHLHEFSVGELKYGRPDYDEGPELLDERKIRLRDLDLSVGDRIGYLYDFGDDWEHVLIVEQIQVSRADAFYPICFAGERATPPEDVGGPYRYEEFLKVMADPNHEEHEEKVQWIGGYFDPEAFDLDEINQRLRKNFRPRKKA